MPAKIPHPPQFSKRFLSRAEKLLQRWPSLCKNGVIGWHRRSVLHIGSDAAGYEVQAKRLTIIVQQKFHGEISSGEVRRLLECT